MTPSTPAVPGPGPGRQASLSPGRVLVVFGIILAVIVGLATVVSLILGPDDPEPPCGPDVPLCADPPGRDPIGAATPRPSGDTTLPSAAPAAPPLVAGTVYRAADVGYEVVYDPDRWTVTRETGTDLALDSARYGIWVVFEGRNAADADPTQIIRGRLEVLRRIFPDLAVDEDAYDAIPGAHIGFVDAQGDPWVGTETGADGVPSTPYGFALIAATDGRISVGVTVAVTNPDGLLNASTTRQHYLRGWADTLLKDFRWRPAP